MAVREDHIPAIGMFLGVPPVIAILGPPAAGCGAVTDAIQHDNRRRVRALPAMPDQIRHIGVTDVAGAQFVITGRRLALRARTSKDLC